MRTKGVIYVVTHKESGESYIGATTKTMESRKADHEHKATKGLGGQFQEAIATQGPEAFTWTQIDTANSINELARKEKDYIVKYNTREKGYNSDSGGGMKKTIYQYNVENGHLINTYDCLESAANAVNANKRSISSACLGANKTCKGYYWSYYHPITEIVKDQRRKTVLQMDSNGYVLAEYRSVAEASRTTGVSRTCISRCCRGERGQSGGLKWSYN